VTAVSSSAPCGSAPPDRVAPPAIALRGVVKRFGALTAVDGLDLEVPAGICLGLLGPNGAGKSTTMRLLTAQAIADEGTIEVLGLPLPRRSKEARARCGVVPQQDNLDAELTVRQNLAVFARLYRVPAGARAAAVDRALQVAQLTDRADSIVEELSGGMRRRLLIARGLVHSPELVLLDEPTVGLDPQVRQELWTLIDALRAEGVTVLMSTHYIEEAERLADLVAVMAAGRVVARGRPSDLVERYAGREVVEVFGPPPRLAEVEQWAGERGLRTRRAGPAVVVARGEVPAGDRPGADRPGTDRPGTDRPAVLDVPEGDGWQHRRPATLEDVFVLLTGETVA